MKILFLTTAHNSLSQLAEELASSNHYAHLLEEKRRVRQADEDRKPLQAYREEELQEMWLNFFGANRSYHLARKRFVYKGLMPGSALKVANGG
jgi:putative two-component system hydrogenase maturation factor HypX/HoxX